VIFKLEPKDIAKYWDSLAPEIEKSFQSDLVADHRVLNKMLETLLLNLCEMWIIAKSKITSAGDISAFCITGFRIEMMTGIKSLVIFTLNSFAPLSRGQWREMISFAVQYARDNGCKRLCAYSYHENVIKISKILGANTDMRFLTWRI